MHLVLDSSKTNQSFSEIREAVAKESAQQEVEETSDADTITEDSSYLSSDSESDVVNDDESEESDGNDADLDTEDDPKDTLSKQTIQRSRFYEGDIDTDSTSTVQLATSTAQGNTKGHPLLDMLFKGRTFASTNGSPSAGHQGAQKAIGKHSLDFTGVKLKPAQGNSGMVTPDSPESDGEDEIVILDYNTGQPSDCPLNTTYVVKTGQDPVQQQQPALSYDGIVPDVKCGEVKLRQKPSNVEGPKSVDSGPDRTFMQFGNITFDPVFNSTRNDTEFFATRTSANTSGQHGLFFQKSALANPGKKLASPLGTSKTTPKTFSSAETQSERHTPKSKSVSVDLFMSKSSFSSHKSEEIVPFKENKVEARCTTAVIKPVSEQDLQTGQQHLEQPQIINRSFTANRNYTVLRPSENSIRSLSSATSFQHPSKVKETGAPVVENKLQDFVTSEIHESRSDIFKTPDLLKFKRLSLNTKNSPVTSRPYNRSFGDSSEGSSSHTSGTVCTEVQKQFDNLFYQSRPPEEIAALLSPLPIIMARRGNSRTSIHRKEASPASVLSHLKDMKSPPQALKTAVQFSRPAEIQNKSPTGVKRSSERRKSTISRDGIFDVAKTRHQVQSALPKLITHTSRVLRDASSISNQTPSLTPEKKSLARNSVELTKRATSTPSGKQLKNSTFDCGISTIEVNDLQPYKANQIPPDCPKSPATSWTKQTKNKSEFDSSVVNKKRISTPKEKGRIRCPKKSEGLGEIRRSKTKESKDDNEGFDFKELANVRLSPESPSAKRKRLKLTEKEVAWRKKSSMYSTNNDDISFPRKASNRNKIRRKKDEILRLYELSSDESVDMSCRPLSGNGGMTYSDDSEVGSASPHSSPENSFEQRVMKLRSRNRESVPARKSLAGAFRVAISSSGSGYNTDLKAKGPDVRTRQSPMSSKRPLSSEDEDSGSSDWNPVPKKQRSVRKTHIAPSNNNSLNTTAACGGPGKCKKFFCFDCSDML